MKVTLNKIDSVNATLIIEVAKDDYAAKVKQGLKDFNRKAEIPGFRKGMVPAYLLEKKYGKALMVEEIEKLLSEQLKNYITENKLDLLGEPLPRKEEQDKLNFDIAGDYQFTFDLGLAPEVNVQLTKKDIFPYYRVVISDEMIDTQIEKFKKSYAAYEKVDQYEDKDLIKGLLVELNEDGTFLENGISNEQATLLPSYMTEEEEKNKFLTAKLNDEIIFNPFKAYQGAEVELASFLAVTKETVNDHTGNFSFTINEISRYMDAEINQELFDKIYEPGTVTSEEQFRDRTRELIADKWTPQANYKLYTDIQKLLDEKNKDVRFPDEFLKRRMFASDSNLTADSVDKSYPDIISGLKYQLFQNKIAEENNINITEEDVRNQLIIEVKNQFSSYGINNIPDHLLNSYAQKMGNEKEMLQEMANRAIESKIMSVLKKTVTLEPKEVTAEEFIKIIDPKINEQENEQEKEQENEQENE
jgi:trigger factor